MIVAIRLAAPPREIVTNSWVQTFLPLAWPAAEVPRRVFDTAICIIGESDMVDRALIEMPKPSPDVVLVQLDNLLFSKTLCLYQVNGD